MVHFSVPVDSWSLDAHRKSGGSVDLPATDGDLDSTLAAMARDVYPLFLLPAQDEPFGLQPALGSSVFRHPAHEEFADAVMGDSVLAKLFPSETETSGRHGQIYRSTGSGGSVQLSLFAETLIKNGWQLAVYRKQSPALQEFVAEVLGLIGIARDAVEGKEVSVRAIVGITGVRLPDEQSLELPWGELRPVTPADERLFPPGLAGKLQTTTAEGQQVEIDYAGDVVMEFDVPYAIKIRQEMAALTDGWPVSLSGEIVMRRLETLRLALLLADEKAAAPIIAGTWQVYLDPLATGMSMSWSDPRRLPHLMPTALSAVQATAWIEWVKLIDGHRVEGIDIAVRRTLLAAAERTDPTDALVDAVIAWENLVGSSEGEPTLRVSAALAWLLGTDAASRKAIRKQVSGLYNLRSKVVHGNRLLKPQEADARRREALDLAIRALRMFFQQKPDLLTSCKDSGERSLRLLLNDEAVDAS